MRTNVAEKTPVIYTHEGAVARHITPIQQLRRLILACLLWEDSFYVSGVDSAKAISDAVDTVLKTAKNGAREIAELAVEVRTEGKLRHAPLYLALALVQAGKHQTKLGEECRAVVADTLTRVIQRPDEIPEFISMLWKSSKTPIPNQVKKGLGAAFNKFDKYSLSKYANREGKVSLRDALFMVHARPKDAEQADLWKKLAAKELVAPDTWESNLSAGADKKETFTRLIEEKKLGALALLRNLRNMQQSGVSDSLITKALSEIKVERVLPFRFISAAKYAPQLEPQLEEAMFKCIQSFEKLPGKTALCIDCSGSMGTAVSSKSEISRQDAASALGMILRELCDGVVVIGFGSTAAVARPRRGFALRDEVRGLNVGHATMTDLAVKLANKEKYDRIIVVTDEQSRTNLPNPLPGTRGFVINVAAYKNGIGYGIWNHIDGFSENTIGFIHEYEKEGY